MKLVMFIFLYTLLNGILVTFFVANNQLELVAIQMLWLLFFLWVIMFGVIFYYSRNPFKRMYQEVHLPIWLKFTLFSIIFSLIEEAVAVGINDTLSPRTHGIVKLTDSTNYIEVVTRHSVIALVPMFLIVGILLQKYKWSPLKTYIIFGIFGVLAEMTVGGLVSLIQFGFWILVYGLMVYLPAYASQ